MGPGLKPAATGFPSVDNFRETILEVAGSSGLTLSSKQLKVLSAHHRLLVQWGRRTNLTAIHDTEEIIRRHFMEGLLAGSFLTRNGVRGAYLDLGSGNGFPAVPIRVACAAASPLILVESSRKRTAFLRALVREAGWTDARVESRRVLRGRDLEDLPCDIFTTRGVLPFPLLVEGLPFLRPGGTALLFMRRSTLEREIPVLSPTLRLVAEASLPGRQAGLLLLQKNQGPTPPECFT